MPILTVGGRATHVQELGEGPAVVMVHGLIIGSLASWYFTAAPELAKQHHRVRVYDLRGHGRSERAATGYDTRTLAGDLDALCGDLESFDLVGHSWGGLVALRYAMDHPGRVRRLAIVEAPLPPSSALEMADFLDSPDPARLLEALPAPLREAAASGRRQAQRLLDSVRFLAFESSLLADVRSEPDPSDAELARVSAPVLLAYGRASRCAPAGERLARVLPNARLLMFDGGHYLHLDAREALTRVLAEHLAWT